MRHEYLFVNPKMVRKQAGRDKATPPQQAVNTENDNGKKGEEKDAELEEVKLTESMGDPPPIEIEVMRGGTEGKEKEN